MRLLMIGLALVIPAITLWSQENTKPNPLELAQPGPEHAELKSLVGDWSVAMTAGERHMGKGKAAVSTVVGDRFLIVDGNVSSEGTDSEFRFTIGFDRRNAEYEITLLDSAGTYSVTARGKPDGKLIRMFGSDNDPYMKKMGIDKKFAFDLRMESADEFSITTIYVDNRTENEKLIPAFRYSFARKR